MNDKSTIKDLENQAANTKEIIDRLNRALYGMTFEELVLMIGGTRNAEVKREAPAEGRASEQTL